MPIPGLGWVSVEVGACLTAGFLILLSIPMVGTIVRCHKGKPMYWE